MKPSKFYRKDHTLLSSSKKYSEAVISVDGAHAQPYSQSAIEYLADQFNSEEIISQFAQWRLLGDKSKIRHKFAKVMPNGRTKTVRLHHTSSNVMPTVAETVGNLLTIGLHRSVYDPSSLKNYTSPLHKLTDGYFHLGYDIVLIPTDFGLQAIVNPTENYNKWIDIAIVGQFHGANALTLMYDRLLKDFIWNYAQDLKIRDHHPWEPAGFGVGSTTPIPISSLKNPMAKLAQQSTDILKNVPVIGELVNFSEASAQNSVRFGRQDVMDDLRKDLSRPNPVNQSNLDGEDASGRFFVLEYLKHLNRSSAKLTERLS